MLQYVTDNGYELVKNDTENPKQARGDTMLGLISALATVGSSIYNAWSQNNVNKQNQEYNSYVLQNRLQMSASDAKKAGFSPLAALGVSQPTSGTASQAPQMDMSSLANLLASVGSLDVERAKLAETKRQFDMTHPLAHDEFGETLEETKRANDAAAKNADAAAKNADTQATSVKNQNQQWIVHEGNLVSQFAEDIQLRKDILENDKSFQNKQIQKEFILSRQEASQRQYEQLCNSLGVSPQVEYVSDWDTFIAKSKASETIYKDFLLKYNRAMEKSGLVNFSNNESSADSWNLGANASGTSKGSPGILGVGLDGGHSSSKSQGYTLNPHYLKTTLAYELEQSGYKFYVYSPKGVD